LRGSSPAFPIPPRLAICSVALTSLDVIPGI
jgi:hypothetical protein